MINLKIKKLIKIIIIFKYKYKMSKLGYLVRLTFISQGIGMLCGGVINSHNKIKDEIEINEKIILLNNIDLRFK